MRPPIFFLALLILSGLSPSAWAEKCGVRGKDTTGIVELDCDPVIPSASKVKVKTPIGIRGLTLVDTNAPNASGFRVSYFDTATSAKVIKAIAKSGTPISTCEELQMIGYWWNYPVNGAYVLTPKDAAGNPQAFMDCSATNPSSPAYAGSLWQLGYSVRYPKGIDGIPNSGDEFGKVRNLEAADLGNQGFKPIAAQCTSVCWNDRDKFYGKFNGGLMPIKNLYIARPAVGRIGLFSTTNGATIQNVRLENVTVSGASTTGGLVGYADASTNITNSSVTGSVSGGTYQTGGLVGINWLSTISGSSFGGSVSAGQYTGGLAGLNTGGTITTSYATGSVSGSSDVGGLVASNTGPISRSYATGSVTGSGARVGGLVGRNMSSIEQSYASGSVSGSNTNSASEFIGGLVGENAGGSITDSYSTGNVLAGYYDGGGLSGHHYGTGIIQRCYSTGSVYNKNRAGGLVGWNSATIIDSFSTGVSSGSVYQSGGLLGGHNEDVGTLTNDWWFNKTNMADIGYDSDNVSVTKAAYLADFDGVGNTVPPATGGAVYSAWSFYNATTNPNGTWESASGKLPHLKCQGGKIWNATTNECECPSGTSWSWDNEMCK